MTPTTVIVSVAGGWFVHTLNGCHPERSEAAAKSSRKPALTEVEGDPAIACVARGSPKFLLAYLDATNVSDKSFGFLHDCCLAKCLVLSAKCSLSLTTED